MVNAILYRTRMNSRKPRHAPVFESFNWSEALKPLRLITAQTKQYQSILGDLRYLTDSTRLYIHSGLSRLAENMHSPIYYHSNILCSLLQYLNALLEYGILYNHNYQIQHNSNPITTYKDAVFANYYDFKSMKGVFHTSLGPLIC